MKKSIITDNMDRCFWCGSMSQIQIHHIFGGSNRKCSDEDGLVVPLCMNHHTGPHGVHFNQEMADSLHRYGQKKWMAHYHKSIDDFRQRYRKNYLEVDDED